MSTSSETGAFLCALRGKACPCLRCEGRGERRREDGLSWPCEACHGSGEAQPHPADAWTLPEWLADWLFGEPVREDVA
jgi:hypothetical protein